MGRGLSRRAVNLGLGSLVLGGTAGSALFAGSAAAQGAYAGKTVRFITQRSVHQNALAAKLQSIGKGWGVQIEVRPVTANDLEQKVVLDYVAKADTWDIMYTGGIQRLYEWWGRGIAEELTPLIKQFGNADTLGWDDFAPSAREAVTIDGKIIGLPCATSDQTMAYRKDLVEHADEKSAFAAKYGYALAAPETYAQYLDIARFFTRKKGETLAGVTLTKNFYGTVMPNKKGAYIFHNYENLALAYGSDIYDPATNTATLRTKPALEAVEFFAAVAPLMPPGHLNMANAEATASFVSGDVALYLEYFDRVVGTTARPDSKVQPSQIGYALPPSVPDNPKGYKHACRSGPPPIAISSLSKNKEVAYKLLEAVLATPVQLEMARTYPGYMPNKLPALRALETDIPQVAYLTRALDDPTIAFKTDVALLPYPGILRSDEISDAVGNALQAIVTGAPINGALAEAETKVTEALASAAKQ